MKITNQLSIATLVLAGVFATGCSQQQSAGGSQVSGGSQQSAGGSQVSGGSQQSAGGSQVSGGSQQSAGGSQVSGGSQQSAGGSQVSGGSQQSGSQQQVKEAPPAVDNKQQQQPPAVVKAPPVKPPVRRTNRWTHSHPAQVNCTKSVTHTHKYGNAGHRHTYSCSRPAAKQQRRQPPVDVFALQRKLKAKGYYKGPIDGVVGPSTRSALQRFMQR